MADKLRHQMYLIEETDEEAGERRRLNREYGWLQRNRKRRRNRRKTRRR